ncbi:MAG TPA: GNAT family N-acetyltransferase [Acidimicrobiia bacterium]|nr:GNAT family N-acetyltransferase [Acidimicrobiia bacterium]
MGEVRAATEDEAPALGAVLSRAFLDDPGFAWAAPHDGRRQRLGPRYFELLMRHVYLPKGETHTTGDGRAVALWAPPDRWKVPARRLLPLLPVMARACGATLPRTMRMLGLMERLHEQHVEPHYYLAFVGTDPPAQGQGLGSALLAHVLHRCDVDGVPAYLEASSPANRSLYHRHGFEVVDELRWPGGGPPFWPMWREPREPGR